MSKRRINKQQSLRILKNQQAFQDIPDENKQDGLVISRFSRHADIEDLQGQHIRCALRPNLESIVAGDRVVWQPLQEGRGVVLSRYQRQSELSRTDRQGKSKPVAANISQIMIVVASMPEISWLLLDSYLVMAENLKLKVSIVLNKADLPCDSLKAQLQQCYAPLGYPVLLTSQKDCLGYALLQEALNSEISVFVGQSGVGKSSLISSVLPEEDIVTASISEASQLGCHTTSNSRYYHLPTGGALIDSPGVREFTLGQLPSHEVIYGFRELRALIGQCQFRNCNHIDSPGCALTAARNKGDIQESRYKSFLALT